MDAASAIRRQLMGLAAALLLPALPALGQGRVIEDIQVDADGERTIIRIELACQMRFVADTTTQGGALLELRVAPLDSCRRQGLLDEIDSETFRPAGSEAAGLTEIEFSTLGLGDTLLLLSFQRPVRYSIAQGAALRSVDITVEPLSPDVGASAERRPLSVRVVEPEQARDYIVNLLSTRDPLDAQSLEAVIVPAGRIAYVSQIRIEGELWNRLRLGFFGSEAEAKQALESQGGAFPRAWVGRAEPAEIAFTANAQPPRGVPDLPTLPPDDVEAGAVPSAPAPEDLAGRMAEARAALRDGEAAAAIGGYRSVLELPGEHRAEALEMLGLAYERNGQPALARGTYEQYLREFPDASGRARVAQRLDSLIASRTPPQSTLRDAPQAEASAWDISLGLAQYYHRDDFQPDADEPNETTQSALLTDFDLGIDHAGSGLDLSARLSFNHYHDLLEGEEGGRGDRQRVSFANVEVADADQDWDLRIGRQSLHTYGVLGRFDGIHGSYGLGADKRLHLMAGYPVESTLDSVETDRRFLGAAAEFDDLVGTWDLVGFVNSQTIEGLDARLAVGMETRYFDERRSLTAMLDYDIDFDALNTALLLGTWRLPSRITLSALIDRRQAPILMTRNALIGQPVETISELLIVWSEDEVRSLAADRSAEAQTLTLGIAAPLGERLQLNFDATSSEIGATADSGGVLAVPGTGRQSFLSASLVATGLFATADVSVWHLQVGDSGPNETRVLTWDTRFPIGPHLRINPRLRFALWEDPAGTRRRETVSPALRLLLNAQNHYRLELEIGRDETTRSDALAVRESSGRYFFFGYQAYF